MGGNADRIENEHAWAPIVKPSIDPAESVELLHMPNPRLRDAVICLNL